MSIKQSLKEKRKKKKKKYKNLKHFEQLRLIFEVNDIVSTYIYIYILYNN